MDDVFAALTDALPTLTAWLNVVQALVVISAVGFTARQLWQGSRALELSSFQDLFAGMHASDSYAIRDRVLSLSPDVEHWSKKQWREAREVTDRTQRIGFYARHHFIRKRLVLQMYSLLFIDMWRSLYPYVKRERDRMNTPRYARDFEWLVKQAVKYRKWRNLPFDGRVSTGRDQRT